MKKSYLMIAAAVALFAACAEKDTFKEVANDEVAIDFVNGYIEKTTKAELTNAWFQEDGSSFGVFGFKGATQIFTDEVVTWEGSKSDWTHPTKRFWDKASSEYEFYAYAPSGQAATFTNKKFGFSSIVAKPIVDITTANADLAVATPMTGLSYDHCSQPTATGHGAGHVEFIFNHILSKLSFYVKTDLLIDANGTKDIKELKLNAISLDFPTATSASWAQAAANSVSGAITYSGYTAKDGIGNDGKEIPANYETVVLENASFDVTNTATQRGNIFIVAPVNSTSPSTEHIFGVKVDYTIKYNDNVTESSTAYGVIGGGDGTNGTTQYKPAENTNYAITLNIHPEEIQFCVDKINDWATQTVVETTVK